MLQPSLPLWLDYIESQIGFMLPKAQHQWLINAIVAVAEKLSMTTTELYQKIHHDKVVYQILIDAVVIAETHFFRDKNSLQYIGDLYDKHLRQSILKSFSVLSVGCSTGQEVWSLAMMLDSKKQLHDKFGHATSAYHVMGVDVSQTSLAYAKTGNYPVRAKQEVPAVYQHYLTPMVITEDLDVQTVGYSVHQRLREWTTFGYGNVFDKISFERAFVGQIHSFKVIVCQNMLIYFRRFDQRDILDRLVSLLEEGGYLVLGAAEAWFWQHEAMQKLSHPTVNVWQKLSVK